MENNLNQLYTWSRDLKQTELMPALFIGHGSPMNGIEDNQFSRQWMNLGKEIPTPDHYYPLLHALGLQRRAEEVSFFNDKAVGG